MKRDLLLPGVFTLASLIVLIGLGLWQWQRRAEKLELIATIERRINMPATPVVGLDRWRDFNVRDAAYRQVAAQGTFDHSAEAHVFFALAQGKSGHGGPGYLIITPFRLESGGVIMVNRGSVPQHLKEPARRADGQIAGAVTIVGLMRAPERRGPFAGADDPAKNTFYVRDPAVIAEAKGIGPVAPFLIDLKSPEPAGGIPVPNVTLVNIPNNHLNYAVTWWSLALILAAIFLLYARQSRR